MKTLLLVRHAKSSWDDASISDFDRPLNDRGKKDAPAMAERLSKKKVKIDGLISSPAKRAKKTAEYFAEAFDVKKDKIIFVDELYHADVNAFQHAIGSLPDDLDVVALFSHNPGITEFANVLTGKIRIDNMPTSSVFAVKADVKHWKEFAEAQKEFWFFDYPKSLND